MKSSCLKGKKKYKIKRQEFTELIGDRHERLAYVASTCALNEAESESHIDAA